MKILTLDISSSITGFAIFDTNTSQKYIRSGAIDRYTNNEKTTAAIRFEGMVDAIKGLIGIEYPDRIIVEKPFLKGTDLDSCEYLFKINGCIEYFCKKKHYIFITKTPEEWREPLDFNKTKQKKNRDDKRNNKAHRNDYKTRALNLANNYIQEKTITDDNEAEAICLGISYLGEL